MRGVTLRGTDLLLAPLPDFLTTDLDGGFTLVLDAAIFLADPQDYPHGTPVSREFLLSNELRLKVK